MLYKIIIGPQIQNFTFTVAVSLGAGPSSEGLTNLAPNPKIRTILFLTFVKVSPETKFVP